MAVLFVTYVELQIYVIIIFVGRLIFLGQKFLRYFSHDKAPGGNCNKCDKTCSLFELAEPKDEEVLRTIISKNNRYIPHTPQPVDDGSSTVQQGINFFRNLYAMYNQ